MRNLLSKCLTVFLLSVLLFSQAVATVSAADANTKSNPMSAQLKLFRENINYYNLDACGTQSQNPDTLAPGAGSPLGAEFPNLDPASMAASIDKFIKKQQPNSPLNGLGDVIVASAQKANINPFLVPAIAVQETSLGTAGTPQVAQGNDVFNRRATPSQPHITISTGDWYKWSSVKASVDYLAPENQNANGGGDFLAYLRDQYGDAIDGSDFSRLFALYDPGYSAYAGNVKAWMQEMANDADAASGSGGSGGISGDTRSLAQQILNNKKITFDGGPSGPTGTQFRRLAAGQKAQTDDKKHETEVSPIVLIGLLYLAADHKVQASALTDGSSHNDPKNPHAKGTALDIDYLDGKTTNGSDALANTIVSTLEEVLPNGTRFGMGNNPFSGTKKVGGNSFTAFKDNPNHVHFDVMNAKAGDINKAVQAAAGLGIASGASTSSDNASSQACCPGGDSGSGSSGPIAGNGDIPETDGTNSAGNEYRFLTEDKGLSPVVAAAITGNNIWESGGDQTKLTLEPSNVNSIGATGIAQWYQGRATALHEFAKKNNRPWDDLGLQLAYLWTELSGGYKSALQATESAGSIDSATTTFEQKFEVSGDTGSYPERISLAKKVLQEFGNGATGTTSGSSSGSGGSVNCDSSGDSSLTEDANLKKTITVDKPGKFIKLPGKYSCPGHETIIDSRIAADVAYLADKYNLCANDGLASGHLSHGAGVAVDMTPRDGNSKQAWQDSAEAAARAIGWWGDSANQPQGKVHSCANYGDGDYGECMHEVYPDKFPQWMRWMGYNGAYCHGDPWHIYGGCDPHIHIGWDTPNNDGVSSTIIDKPRASVYAFPAPIPDDLKNLVD